MVLLLGKAIDYLRIVKIEKLTFTATFDALRIVKFLTFKAIVVYV